MKKSKGNKVSKKETVEQQIQRQLKQFKYRNRLSEIVGQFPSNESIEEILNTIKPKK